MENAAPGIDWKEVRITGTVTMITAFVGCLAAVVTAHALILPALEAAKEKKASKADKK